MENEGFEEEEYVDGGACLLWDFVWTRGEEFVGVEGSLRADAEEKVDCVGSGRGWGCVCEEEDCEDDCEDDCEEEGACEEGREDLKGNENGATYGIIS